MNNHPDESASKNLAIIAQSLYLLNLLLAPGLALIGLLLLWWRHRHSEDTLGRCHLNQALKMSLWAIGLLSGGGLILWLMVGDSPAGISMLILYLIIIHTGFVLLGMIALAKALSQQHFHPTGRTCHSNKA